MSGRGSLDRRPHPRRRHRPRPQLPVLFLLEEFSRERAKAVDIVLDALNEADDWTKNNIQAVAEQLSPSVGLPASVLAVSLQRESTEFFPSATK